MPCPCGFARRAFAEVPGAPASMHLVEIKQDSQTHYHERMTEIYVILETEGECFIELNGERHRVEPLTTVMIRPGCRHRPVGEMRILNVAIPVFDPSDEVIVD
ncbi:MAG: cupin domain-containing protein [Verrucomicrobiales bacterium]